MNELDRFVQGTVYVIESQYGALSFYNDKECALDKVTRTDKLYSCKIVDVQREKVSDK